MMKLVVLSDTHGMHRGLSVPDGDILVHAGDITEHGALEAVRAFDAWLGRLPHPVKIVIAGNHDFCFEDTPEEAQACLSSAVYLRDAAVEVDGLRFWGSPWTPRFFEWAFMRERGRRWERCGRRSWPRPTS
jgi:predicted phosphodiesterase